MARRSSQLLRPPLACLLGALSCSGSGESETASSGESATSTSGGPPPPVCVDSVALAGPGFVIDGASPGDHAVAIPCADVNGDDFDDILVTVERPTHPLGFLVFGKADEAPVDLAEIETGEDERGIVLDFDQDGDFEWGDFEYRLAGVGDVNGDGLSDFAAAIADSYHNEGRVHVVFGDPELEHPLHLPAVAEASGGFTFAVDADY